MLIKICGLSDEIAIASAVEAGTDLIGFVFHPKSPRYVTPENAAQLSETARRKVKIVALTANANDETLLHIKSTLRPDFFQLHGEEPLTRVRAVKALLGTPIIKACGVSDSADLKAALNYASIADHLLLDAKPPKGAAYQGGHGTGFDWQILNEIPAHIPYFLAGGLNPENVARAVLEFHPYGIDVSSGVELALGKKDPQKIKDFIMHARAALDKN